MKNKTHLGSIRISRPTCNGRRSKISITIEDATAHVQFFDGEMDLTDFADCLTGQSEGKIKFELRHPDLIGMRSENKREEVPFNHAYAAIAKDRRGLQDEDRSPLADAALKPFEIDGWRARVSDLFNGHRQVGQFGEPVRYTVTFFRHVDPKTGKPVLK